MKNGGYSGPQICEQNSEPEKYLEDVESWLYNANLIDTQLNAFRPEFLRQCFGIVGLKVYK